MQGDRLRQAETIFEAVVNAPPEQREALLAERCAGDPELRAYVERLLREDDTDGENILDRPIVAEAAADTVAALGTTGRALGPYVIRERLGAGGMGEVWRAEQTNPVRRTVALKLIKAGMDSEQVIARFESERQALALMDHPAIAKVLDAGTTPEGRPYFAMEYVPGVPITEYCDRRRLGTRERLELFQRVCDGVQHAHQKAVIHRDLKPSNILVADVDGKPQPRIIDFGVAKATTQKLTERTMYTALGQLIGTPEYMSPEQADLTTEDVDTRTDVYSLGVILYELLVGALPFDSKELRQAGFEGIIKLLREKDPPRPSTKVSSLGERTTEVAQKRHTEPRRLASEIRGDLDWIVMRSLEKNRNRRYGSPQELAQDIGRHLNYKPVLAGPPNPIYRARKFVRRHRVGVAFAATIVLAVIVGFALLTVQNAKIAAARDEAELVTATLEEMLASVDPTKSGRDVTVKEMLDETAKTLGEKFKDQPRIEVRLRRMMGDTYYNLGEYESALEHRKRVVEIQRELFGDEDRRTLTDAAPLVWVYLRQFPGQIEEAEALALETLEISRRVFGEEDTLTLRSMNTLGQTYDGQKRHDEAAALYRASLEIGRRVLGEEHPRNYNSRRYLGQCLNSLGEFEEAESLLRQTLEFYRRAHGEESTATLMTMGNLAELFMAQGRFVEAETILRESLDLRRRKQGVDHFRTISNMMQLARCYGVLGRYEEAEALLQEALELRQRAFGVEHRATLNVMNELGYIYGEQGRLEEAEAMLQETVAARRRVLGEERTPTLESMENLGRIFLYQGRYEEAEELFRKTLEISRRVRDEGDWLTNDVRMNLSCVVARQGRRSMAITLIREALDNVDRVPWYWHTIHDEPDLASLHGDPEFEALAEEVKRRCGEGASAEQATEAEDSLRAPFE